MKPFFSYTGPDPFGFSRSTKFDVFQHESGISGLARIDGDTLYLLAVNASKPGNGEFSRFLAAAFDRFEVIEVLHVWSGELERILAAKGFAPEGKSRWKWSKP